MPVRTVKAKSMADAKKNLARRGSGGKGFIKYVPKNDSLVVRFLTEPDGFIGYWEHWTGDTTVPCIGEDEGCPGCESNNRSSFVYVAPVLLPDDDRVVPFQVKSTVYKSLMAKYDKYGTIMDADFEISKSGEGRDNTTYDVERLQPKKRNLGKYDMPDLEQVLEDAYDAVYSDDDEDGDEPDLPRKWSLTKMQNAEWADLKQYAKSCGVTLQTRKRSELIAAIDKRYK